ncbi:response regulator [Adhaeribacter radiodurans]|uniref:Response regulator n=1 Tax=Adhaeribacter radiodurans TaxID=2745197 RepID=A0A7L7LD84_9BACT|nr:response regulator [Adhaeribacter radiodurans]QMU30654.1 response regulator [Adhaeribacter radiodurans]
MSELQILLAEDNKLNQLMIKKVIEDFGFALDIVETGKEAVEKLAEQHYDLILMDVNMPEMDGYTATRHIREKMGHKSNIPIIVVTSPSDHQEHIKSLLLGANTFISKPIDADILLTEIMTLVITKPILT